MPVTEEQVQKEMKFIHPDQKLSSDGVQTIQFILRELSDLSMDEISKYLSKEIDKCARSEYNKIKIKCQGGYKKYELETEDDIEKLAQKEAVNYLIAEIIELSGNVARDYCKTTINSFHIWKAIYDDEELLQTVSRLDNKLPKIPMNIKEDLEAKEFYGNEYKFSYANIEANLRTTKFSFSKLAKETIYKIFIQASNIYNTPEKIKSKISEIAGSDPESFDNYTIFYLHNLLINILISKINENDSQLHAMCGYKSMSFDALCETIDACEVFDYLDQAQPKS